MTSLSRVFSQDKTTFTVCKVALVACLSVALLACDVAASSNSYNNANPGKTQPEAGKIVGSWMHCSSTGKSTTIVFSEYRFDEYFAYHEPGSNCASEPLRHVGLLPHHEVYNSGTYEILDGHFKSRGGLQVANLNMTADTLMGSPIKSADKQFDIVHVKNGRELVFGNRTSAFEDTRPNQLELDQMFEFASTS